MSGRLMTWRKATALVPLALLSGAWTASLAATGTATAATDGPGKLPDGTDLPAGAVEAPASVSVPGEIGPGVPSGAARTVAANASVSGIPSAALAAYQRAAEVIDAADRSCNLDWPLIAAIGRVESDHGRYGGNTLDDQGVTRPGIYGIPLDGSNGTTKITDTDGGKLDDDPVFDRAIGPMQFIPSTWAVVGVDGDGDGVRNPQDIDDAALATAVYLCSGDEDLSTVAGQRAAVYRYNHSQQYVDLVLSIARAYTTGNYSAVPNSSASPATFTPYPGGPAAPGKAQGPGKGTKPGSGKGSGGSTSGGQSSGGSTGGSGGSTGGSGGSGGTGGTGGSGGGTTDTATGPVQDTVTKTTDSTTKVLITSAQAVDLCTAELKAQYGSAPQKAVDKCVASLQGKTLDEAKAAVGGIVAGLADLVGSILGGVLGGGGGLLGN